MYWDDGSVWHVDNLATEIGDNFEMGSISIEKSSMELDRISRDASVHDMGEFLVERIRVASADNGNGFISDCAIALMDGQRKELIISTAVPPTTVNFWLSGISLPETGFPLSCLEWGAGQTPSAIDKT